MDSPEPILEMRGIGKRLPGVVALQDVEIKVGCGEVLGLVGENGAGKSTLTKVPSGAYQADVGDIFVAGERYRALRRNACSSSAYP